MIDHLDNLLRHLFLAKIDELKDEAQVRFQPPDGVWRDYVKNLTVDGSTANALNVYLADVRENRKLRSNEFTRTIKNGAVSTTPAPARIDCHYLITAWSPADVNTQVEPILDEHALLYKVIGVLMNHETLNPKEIYGEDNLPNGFPPSLAEADLPLAVLPVEGFGKLPEFWGTVDWRWKPMVYLVVTLPVILSAQEAGPLVIAQITKFQQRGKPETEVQFVQIAGRVYESGEPAKPVAGAHVLLEEKQQSALTDGDGRFSFGSLAVGNYTLKVSKEEFHDASKTIKAPKEKEKVESFDVTLTKSS